MYKYNIQNIIVGAERTGKTYFVKRFTETVLEKKGKPVFAYNVGQPDDYEGFLPIDILDASGIPVFKHENDVYDLRKIGFFVHRHKKVYAHRSFDPATERQLIDSIYANLGGAQFIIDDCRALFRHGVSKEFAQLFGRKFHAGVKSGLKGGLDIHMIFHGLNEVNNDLYNYATNFTLFRFNQKPVFAEFKRDLELYELFLKAHGELKALPLRHYFTVFYRGQQQYYMIKNKPI